MRKGVSENNEKGMENEYIILYLNLQFSAFRLSN